MSSIIAGFCAGIAALVCYRLIRAWVNYQMDQDAQEIIRKHGGGPGWEEPE